VKQINLLQVDYLLTTYRIILSFENSPLNDTSIPAANQALTAIITIVAAILINKHIFFGAQFSITDN
jgi:hypothetical protein